MRTLVSGSRRASTHIVVSSPPLSSSCSPAGMYSVGSDHTLDTAADACTPCPAGRWNPSTCVPGRGLADSCVAGPAGTFSTVVGSLDESDWVDCPENTFSTEGSASCESCASGRVSEPGATQCDLLTCDPGSVVDSTIGACVECEAGRYSDNVACLNCPSGRESSPGASECTCPPGSLLEASECIACEPGRYSDSVVCHDCDAGRSAGRGSIVCDKCPKVRRGERGKRGGQRWGGRGGGLF